LSGVNGTEVEQTTGDELGPTLKTLRSLAGMTQEELAERAGISARTVSDVERGLRTVVHHDTARRLASALGLEGEQRRIFEGTARGRAAARVSPSPSVGLPAVATPFLGRSQELASVKATLLGGQVRLLTLTGPGGIGKTRLAIEAALGIQESFPDGCFFVSLGELKEASLVAPELAKSIGAVETGPGLEELLIARLAGRRVLVVLDTFEHLTPAAPLVYALMLGCPEITFLVTSRSALRLRGEYEFPVPPLESPAEVAGRPIEGVLEWPATALFWERALAVRPDLRLDAQSALLVIEICRRLDGLPLAIELAAARVKHLPLVAIRVQLEHRLELLVGGPLDLPLRQRAIRDTVAWSYDLLEVHAQRLLRRLSAFAGGWSLDGAASICGPLSEVGDALAGMSALVDQSLVVVNRNHPTARYDMLDVVGEYAARRLAEAGETEEISRRHALHYLKLAEDAEPNLVRSGHEVWFQLLDVEHANLRKGLAWTIDSGETVLALRYIAALWRYWRQLGEFAEGRRWSDSALAMPGPAKPSLRAKAVWAAAALAFPQGDHMRMAALASEGMELARQSEDPMDRRNLLTITGMVAMLQSRYSEALEPFHESVLICRQLGLSWQLGTSYLNLGTALLHSGSADDAVEILHDGLNVYRALGDDVFAAHINNTMAHAALARNDIAGANRLARMALSTAAQQGERQGIADGLYTLAAVAAARSQPDRAATLAGAAAAVRETIAARPGPFDFAIPGRFLRRIEKTVLAKRWHRSWDAGHVLDAQAAVKYVLARPKVGVRP
jgi:predicted ATPase/transcriptional regulator with XRE-family HTH domain